MKDEHGNWNITNSLERMKEFATEMVNAEGFSNVLCATADDNGTYKEIFE